MNFEFSTAARIVFGAGRRGEVPAAAASFGRRALIVTGRSTDRAQGLVESLAAAGVRSSFFTIPGEPTIEIVQAGVRQARETSSELVIAMGGGSAIDAGKAIAAVCANPGDLMDHLEVIGRAQPIIQPALPLVAIPTTAGTGTEVTRNAVLTSPEHRVKVSLRSPRLLPRLAVVDPELTLDLPPELTASTGLDALTQLVEPYVSCRANPMTDSLCREGITRVARSLPLAYEQACLQKGQHPIRDERYVTARIDMALASLLSGLALANAGLGAVHGFAAPIGGRFSAPHGAVCAVLLPEVMATNIQALKEREPQSASFGRYGTIASILTGKPSAAPEDGIEWVRNLCRDLEVPGLGRYGVTPDAVPDLVEQAAKASSMKANPLPLTAEELGHILRSAL